MAVLLKGPAVTVLSSPVTMAGDPQEVQTKIRRHQERRGVPCIPVGH